jgi:hypothetical protein
MREKYIEERHPRWFSMCIGKRDISDSESIAFAHTLSTVSADTICERHNKLLDALIEMAQAWDKSDHESFTNFWYNRRDK